MVSMLKGILGKVPWVKTALSNIRYTTKGMINLCSERRIKRNSSPIRVGFLCQYIPSWAKTRPLYDRLKNDRRFECYLICVPSGIKSNELINSCDLTNDTYDYMKAHGYDEATNALIGTNEWLDLKKLELEYIFYPRPYNAFMPKPYRNSVVSRYCKCCLIMYGIDLGEEFVEITHNREFMSNVAYYAAHTSYLAAMNQKRNRLLHALGLQKSVFHGWITGEGVYSGKDKDSPSWDFSRNGFRAIWTPRWTTDPSEGGSNFLNYRNDMLRFSEENKDIDFLYRPHPLMFDNFLSTGEMTQHEVDLFKQKCDEIPNISLDKEKEYIATFWNSDILISDISAIVPEYLLTGKPVIFCMENMTLKFTKDAKRMMEACYVAESIDDVFRHVLNIKNGHDPLRDKRVQICAELFGTQSDAPSVKIAEDLAKR